MKNFNSKEERELLEKMNQLLGTDYRVNPYNLNNIDEMNEVFTKVVAEYIDYQKYYLNVAQLYNDFDESMECYDPITWNSLHFDNLDGDPLLLDVDEAMNQLDSSLSEIATRAENKCRDMLELILNQNEEIQNKILGAQYSYTEESLDKVFEDAVEIDNTYSINESKEAFLEVLRNCLG